MRSSRPVFVWADGPHSSAQTPRHLRVSAGISARRAAHRYHRGQRKTPANPGLFARLRMTSRVGRPATENRGVPGSNPGLAIVCFARSWVVFAVLASAAGGAAGPCRWFLLAGPLTSRSRCAINHHVVSSRWGCPVIEHKVGYGSVPVIDFQPVLAGTLGEGPGRN
jgi:hypothetical protein